MPHQIVMRAGEAERSHEVISANQKEEAVLVRELRCLKKAQDTASRQITIDQRILLTKFQKKLRQSQLAHARLMNNKTLERDLLQKTNQEKTMGISEDEELEYQKTLHRRAHCLPDLRYKLFYKRRDTASSATRSAAFKPSVESHPFSGKSAGPHKHQRRPFTTLLCQGYVGYLSDEDEEVLSRVACSNRISSRRHTETSSTESSKHVQSEKQRPSVRPQTCMPSVQSADKSFQRIYFTEESEDPANEDEFFPFPKSSEALTLGTETEMGTNSDDCRRSSKSKLRSSSSKKTNGELNLADLLYNTNKQKYSLLEDHKTRVQSARLDQRMKVFCDKIQETSDKCSNNNSNVDFYAERLRLASANKPTKRKFLFKK